MMQNMYHKKKYNEHFTKIAKMSKQNFYAFHTRATTFDRFRNGTFCLTNY